MFRRKLVAVMMVTMLAVSTAACGDKAVSSDVNVENTLAVESTTQVTTKSAEQEASEKASQEAAASSKAEAESKAEAIKESMAAEQSKAVAEAESKAAAEEASREAAAQAESQAAAAQVGDAAAEAADEVVTVATGRGTANARLQYTANYAVYVELVRLTNELRASLGVGPVTFSESISIASCSKACDYYFENYYDGPEHTMVDGRAWTSLLSDFNIPWGAAAENIARGPAFKTAQQMFEGWKNSQLHYENMINPAYTKIGVGSCGYVWIMDLTD